MRNSKRQSSMHNSLPGLIIAAVITIVLFNIPNGYYVNYPFLFLGTWFHEMGHGLMGILMGGEFLHLEIFANGSGLAYTATSGLFSNACVAAAGLMSPPIVGGILIISGRNSKVAKLAMNILGGVLLLSVVIWVRSMFGIVVISLWGVFIIICSLKLPISYRSFAVQFLGVQAWASAFVSLDYMFSDNAGSLGVSDTQAIANILLLPYWFWGGLISLFAIVMLWISLKYAFKE